jgi:hypothetical protein
MAESVTASISVKSVAARDVKKTVVVSPISVDMVAVVSRPVMLVQQMMKNGMVQC